VRAGDYPFFAPPFLAFAHRGGYVDPSDAACENTLAAFSRAVSLGYTYLETDVHLTRDGVLVAFHDDALDRLIGRHGTIRDVTFAELREHLVGGAEPVPTLDELFEALPRARFNIDMKADDTIVPLVVAIRRHSAEDRVCVASFNSARLVRFRWLMGARVPTSAGTVGIVSRLIPGLGGVLPGRAVALQVPVTRRVLGRPVAVLTRQLIARAHTAGLKVQAWTIDDEDEMERLIEAGVDGLVSNRIDRLKAVLERRGLWAD